MDELYDPYQKRFADSDYWLNEAKNEGRNSNTLQMLTGMFAVALFLLGITTVMKIKKLVAYLVLFSIALWLIGLSFLLSVPTIFS
jgi:ABC-type bacteriocin/lantibiotic exporter with double-glycine peptidase domain